MRWKPRPRILKRRSDGSLWTAAGDCPFPFTGFNFVRLHKAKIGWWADFDDRWVFFNFRDFDIIR